MKKAFSLIELIFAVLIIGIITSIAAPKLFNFSSKATSTVLIQDTKTIISSIQSHYMLNGVIEKISECVDINKKYWNISDTQIENKENDTSCIVIALDDNQIELTINQNAGPICQEIYNSGIRSEVITLTH